ncbi:hypothetical protein SPHV1_2380014 [Novosphingobium sp. KN65.2]|nr:hypothetical protein SPHV1_2380014 [Novosphingobium sp. KN65.2]
MLQRRKRERGWSLSHERLRIRLLVIVSLWSHVATIANRASTVELDMGPRPWHGRRHERLHADRFRPCRLR